MSVQPTTNAQQNLVPNEPDLQDVLNFERKRLMLDFNCHAIARIQTFNAVNQTATIVLAYQQTYFTYNSDTQAPEPSLMPYPVLVDCPVYVPGGGGKTGGVLTFPVAPGDECLVAFNDRDIDNWFSGQGSSGATATLRLHAFTDALIFVGFRSLANSVPAYDTANTALRNFAGTVAALVSATDALLKNPTTQVGTMGELALIKTTLGGTLGAAFQTFCTTQAAACTGPLAPLAAGFTQLGTTLAEILA